MNHWLKMSLFALVIPALAACSKLHAQQTIVEPTDFQSCAAAGYPVVKSVPPRCITRSGKIFTNEVLHTIDGRICKDRCGDGVCQQIVCQAAGCPCPETPENCPKDCAENSF